MNDFSITRPDTSPAPLRTKARRLGLMGIGLAACLAASAFPGSAQETNAPAAKPAAPAVAGTNVQHTLVFKNGDLLRGALQSIQGAKEVTWRHPDAGAPSRFPPQALSEVLFDNALPRESVATNACRVVLLNDDQLEGKLVSLEEDRITLDTWYAGALKIPRGLARSIVPISPGRSLLFEGPYGLEGWTMGKVNAAAIVESGEWKYKNEAFYANKSSSIARDVKLPDVASIQFDIAWKNFFYMAVALYTENLQPVNLANKDTEPDFSGFYSLQINTFSANLLPVKKNDPLRYLGQTPLPSLSQKNSAHVEIRVNKPKKTIALLIDGALARQWTDTEDFAGQGTAIRFVHQGQGVVKLGKIRVTEWDGQMEDKGPPVADQKQDAARLRNGDRIAGKIDEIKDGKLGITMQGAKLSIPFERIKIIDLATEGARGPQPPANPVRATFVRGGSVTLQIDSWDAAGLKATIPGLGDFNLLPAAFSRFQWDPKPVKPERTKTGDFF